MPPFPFVSVIIPTFNGKALLAVCLPSLRGQSYPADRFEVIVVDDASGDGTVEYLAAEFPEARVVALAQNSGFIAACNAGVAAAAAQGEILVLLNNDTEAEPGWLAALVAALLEHPDAGSAASKMLLFDRRNTLHTAGDLMGKDGIPRNRGVWEKDVGQYDQDRSAMPGSRPAASIRRCGCTWRTWTWPGACSGWAGARSTRPKPASITSSARPAAACWPATTPAATHCG